MPQISPVSHRLDPYKSFKLRMEVGHNVYVGSLPQGLTLSSEVVKHRSGGDPSTSIKSPGRNKYESITLNRGITVDTSFSNWASQVWGFGSSLGSEVSLSNFRKDIYLEFYNEAGQLIVDYKISDGWVHEHQIVPTPGYFQHLIGRQIGESVHEKLAKIFQDSLDRSGQGIKG